jgi:hypothetical protein
MSRKSRSVASSQQRLATRVQPGTDIAKTQLTKSQRCRRVLILCVHFTRNLGYLRGAEKVPAGWKGKPLHGNVNFCITAYNNSLDICVLEWCKLFGDDPARLSGWSEHYWGKVLSNPAKFEMELLHHLNIDTAAFEAYRLEIRSYRDKFVAHLDSELRAEIPLLDIAHRSVEFYYDYIVRNEVQTGDLAYLPVNVTILHFGYEQSEQEAISAYTALAGKPT